jgi:hypothetical protein
MLRRKEADKLARKRLHDQVAAVAEMPVCGSLIAKQSQPLSGKKRRRRSKKLFYANCYHE